MKIKVSELSGIALDWAMAKSEGHHTFFESGWRCEIGDSGPHDIGMSGKYGYSPSTDWSQAGPLIERCRVQLEPGSSWIAKTDCGGGFSRFAEVLGHTALIAACRAIVASVFGDEVEIPQELAP